MKNATKKSAKTTKHKSVKPVIGELVRTKNKASVQKPTKTTRAKGIETRGASGVLGFCYRSPAVVKFMLPTHRYQLINVGERGEISESGNNTGRVVAQAGREIVYMHRSIVGFRAFVNRAVAASDKQCVTHAYHIVFDTYDQVARYPGIAIMDLQSQGQSDWQVQRTYPEQIVKRFNERKGVSPDLVAMLADATLSADPEDLIHTDAKVRDAERQAKTKSMLHVIQDLQAKNADKRNAIQKLICGFVSGQFVDANHVIVTKPIRVCRDADRCVVDANLISTKSDKEAFARSLSMLAEQFRAIDLPLRRPALEKIANLVSGGEYVGLMRALLLIQRYGLAPDQACARTGANVCAVALVRREVFAPNTVIRASDDNRHVYGAVTLVKHAQAQNTKHDVVFNNPVLRVWNRFRKKIEVVGHATASDTVPARVPNRGDSDVVIAKHDAKMSDSVLDTSAVDADSEITESEADAFSDGITDKYAGIGGDPATAARAMRVAKKTMKKKTKTKVKHTSGVASKSTDATTTIVKITKPKKSTKPTKPVREVKNPAPRKEIVAGTYNLTDIIVACRLADAGATPMAILSMSKTATTFSAPRFAIKRKGTNGKTVTEIAYKLAAGEKHKLRWRGTLYRVRVVGGN